MNPVLTDIEAAPLSYAIGDRCPRGFCRGRLTGEQDEPAIVVCLLCSRRFPRAGYDQRIPESRLVKERHRVFRDETEDEDAGPGRPSRVTEKRVLALQNLSIGEICFHTGLSRSQVHRLLARSRKAAATAGVA